MSRIPVLFIYDESRDEIYCATNLGESDALEITMSAIEENVEEQFHCHKFNAQIYNKALEHMIVYYEYVPVL